MKKNFKYLTAVTILGLSLVGCGSSDLVTIDKNSLAGDSKKTDKATITPFNGGFKLNLENHSGNYLILKSFSHGEKTHLQISDFRQGELLCEEADTVLEENSIAYFCSAPSIPKAQSDNSLYSIPYDKDITFITGRSTNYGISGEYEVAKIKYNSSAGMIEVVK